MIIYWRRRLAYEGRVSASGLCVGCLGSQRCWVCSGEGNFKISETQLVPCSRCDGSGACHLCQKMTYVLCEPLPSRGFAWHS